MFKTSYDIDIDVDVKFDNISLTADSYSIIPKFIRNMIKTDSRLKVLGKISQGSSSDVYEIADNKNNIYALKIITGKTENVIKTENAIESGKKEIQYLQKLSHHPEIVKLYGYKIEKLKVSLLLEYAFSDFFNVIVGKYININNIDYYWNEIIKSVSVIHSYNIIHLDLKPDNFVLVDNHIKLIDFGFALTLPENSDTIPVKIIKGTIDYMSPERLCYISKTHGGFRNIGKPADIWSLGCILYNMIYQLPVYKESTIKEKVKNILDKNYKRDYSKPKINGSKIDESILVIKKCLSFKPIKRPSIEELSKII